MGLANPRLWGIRNYDSDLVPFATQGSHQGENVRRTGVVRGAVIIDHLATLTSSSLGGSTPIEPDIPGYACY
jgi:hypothetical protein